MALPKRRHSTQRGRKRRTHQKVAMPKLVKCENCKQLKTSHRICPHCGFYGKTQVITKKEKKAKPQGR